MNNDNFKWPAWIEALKGDERKRAEVRFMLRLAALYATPDGSIPSMSLKMGLSRNTVHSAYCVATRAAAYPSVPVIKGIEELIGKDVIPRAAFNPEIYGD